uniref:Uncharacterized protein n=1 Tax=Anguilla anguilla TaxID=7936 RepID=A0A0E9WMS3_ANGAN
MYPFDKIVWFSRSIMPKKSTVHVIQGKPQNWAKKNLLLNYTQLHEIFFVRKKI